MQFDTGQHFLQLRNRPHDVRAFDGVLLHKLKLFGSQSAGLLQDPIVHADFSDVVQQRGNPQFVQILVGKPKFAPNQRGIFRHAARMASRVGVFFVDGSGQHPNGAEKQFAIGFRGFFQFLDVLFDVPGHLVEIFSQLADLRCAANLGALMKFTPADGAGGSSKPVNRLADGHRKKISDHDGDQHHHADERERLAV